MGEERRTTNTSKRCLLCKLRLPPRAAIGYRGQNQAAATQTRLEMHPFSRAEFPRWKREQRKPIVTTRKDILGHAIVRIMRDVRAVDGKWNDSGGRLGGGRMGWDEKYHKHDSLKAIGQKSQKELLVRSIVHESTHKISSLVSATFVRIEACILRRGWGHNLSLSKTTAAAATTRENVRSSSLPSLCQFR